MLTFKHFLVLVAIFLPFPAFLQVACTPVFKNYYGGLANEDDEAIAITYCKGGGMIVCGQTTSNSAGKYDGLLMKLSDNGKPEWTKVIGGSEDDKLVKVRQTSDRGFIAAGTSNSLTNINGETWIIKTDSSGTIQWNSHYTVGSPGKVRVKDIIQLSDGSYSVAMNTNDSTTSNNALIFKISSNGNVLWSRELDSGGGDGVNNIAEYNDTLLVAGYAAGDKKDAVLTKLSKANGAIIGATKYVNLEGFDDEAIDVEVIDNNISFSVFMYLVDYGRYYFPNYLHHYKLDNKNSVIYHRRVDLTTSTDLRIEAVQARTTVDGGFIYLANDTTAGGYSTTVKVGPYGMLEWGREFYDYGYKARTAGMDLTESHGYVFAGFLNDYDKTGQRNKIEIYKANRVGKAGNCSLTMALDFIDTANYKILDYSWANSPISSVQAASASMPVNAINFSILNSCSDIICDTIQNLQSACNTNFFAEYKSELQLYTKDVAQLTDGTYAAVGRYNYYWSEEPAIIKTNPNGSVGWIKTYSPFIHSGEFLKVLPSGKDAMLVMGTEGYVIDHGASKYAVIVKIDYSGKVLWSKKYSFYGTEFFDMKPTNDGGCVLTVNENYGSGSNQMTNVIRLDANGDFVWKKNVISRNLVLHNILADDAAVYVVGTAYINYSNANITLFKLNAASGDLVWQKTLKSGTATQQLFPISLEKIADTLVATFELYTPISTFKNKREAGFIKLNPANAQVYGGYKITNLDHFFRDDPRSSNAAQTSWATHSGSDLVFANGGTVNNDTSFYITRVGVNGNVVYSRQYSNLKKHDVSSVRHVTDGFVITGNRFAGWADYNIYELYPFILKTDEQGYITNTSANANCLNNNYAAQVAPFSAVEDYIMIDSVIKLNEGNYYGYFTNQPYLPIVRDVKKASTVFCYSPSDCNTLAIDGEDSICNLQKDYNYRVIKNAGCSAGVSWQFDTTFAAMVASTDSTITIRYKKTGSVSIKAVLLSGCSGLFDQMNVTVIKSAASVDLGPDTVLCAGNTYKLNAGVGFNTYIWKNTAVSDSILTVSAPGTYIITVQDFCNSSFSDTVLIKPASFVFSLGKDTVVCSGDTLSMVATSGFTNYTWLPAYNLYAISANSVKVFPANDTAYIVQAEKWSGCFVKDTVNITVNSSPAIFLGIDTALCANDSISLNAGSNFKLYYWSNGDTNATTFVHTAGLYSISATTAEGCHSSDTINITFLALPVVSLDQAPNICFGTTKTFDAGIHSNYKWHDGSNERQFIAKGPGTYFVSVTDQNGCTNSDSSVIVGVLPMPKGFLPFDTGICSYGSIDIAPSVNYRKYLWSTNESSRVIRVDKPGMYTLEVTDENNCVGVDTIVVTTKDCMQGLFVPSAFTPNGDGTNDKLKALLFGNIAQYNFKIYNRLGQLVFQTSNSTVGWDGKAQGVDQETGTFVWVCNFRLSDQQTTIKKGTILLIR